MLAIGVDAEHEVIVEVQGSRLTEPPEHGLWVADRAQVDVLGAAGVGEAKLQGEAALQGHGGPERPRDPCEEALHHEALAHAVDDHVPLRRALLQAIFQGNLEARGRLVGLRRNHPAAFRCARWRWDASAGVMSLRRRACPMACSIHDAVTCAVMQSAMVRRGDVTGT